MPKGVKDKANKIWVLDQLKAIVDNPATSEKSRSRILERIIKMKGFDKPKKKYPKKKLVAKAALPVPVVATVSSALSERLAAFENKPSVGDSSGHQEEKTGS
jgi:hypothetical protein